MYMWPCCVLGLRLRGFAELRALVRSLRCRALGLRDQALLAGSRGLVSGVINVVTILILAVLKIPIKELITVLSKSHE